MSRPEIKTKAYPLVGNGHSSPYKPNVESKYSWRIVEWIGNYNVVKVEYWEETENKTEGLI